jgi:hypothetical protein
MWARNGEPLPYGKPPGIGDLFNASKYSLDIKMTVRDERK